MRQKSDRKKLEEGRCLGEDREYIGFLKANEAKSVGASEELYDPVEGRTVDVLSAAEREFFWIMRYRDEVWKILEQRCLDMKIVQEIRRKNGFPPSGKIHSTDFLIIYKDGKTEAYSIKKSRDEFNRQSERYRIRPEKYNRLLERQIVEKEYWENKGIPFRIAFGSELNHVLARNIETCMRFYDSVWVSDCSSMLKYLVAHKEVRLTMDREILKFESMIRGHEEEIVHMYRRCCNGRIQYLGV